MTGFRPKRFDVAGAHPDEAWRAVANIAESVEDLRKQFVGEFPGANVQFREWQSSKPLRFSNVRDVEVQQFLERGVKIVDGLAAKLPVGLSRGQREIRDRSNELAKSMEKVLARRVDEPEPFDPWHPVRIRVESAAVQEGRRGLSFNETRDRYRLAMRGCFPRGPAQAQRGRAVYRTWEENAERLGNNPPLPEAAKPWQRFIGVTENMKLRDQAKGIVWGRVDEDGIDFKPALTPRPAWQSRPRMRM